MTSAKKEVSLSSPQPIFGEISPWGEPAYCNSLASPYYNESHLRLRTAMRKYIDENILPHHLEWEAAGAAPREVAKAWARSGFAFTDIPSKYRPTALKEIAGIPADRLDIFHFLIITDEVSRVEGGVIVSCGGATEVGVAPVLHHGTEEQKQQWLPGLFSWTTSFCLGMTEPTGGSDLSRINTTARKSDDGKHYVVNGHKKWISGSPWATHMTAAVRTGGKGLKGISLLVIPLTLPGITIRKVPSSGQNAGGASWVTLENVQVPAENLLGKENAGFSLIVTNFNKERLIMSINCNRKARTCLTHALQYAHDRETFGKPLIAHQIIRNKLTTIARYVESHWAWIEQIAYHVQVNPQGWQSPDIGGKIALAKVHGGRILEMAAREAQQVLGGVGYQRGGVGGQVEQISRDLRMFVVGVGSEEILDDLAFREETKRSEKLGTKL